MPRKNPKSKISPASPDRVVAERALQFFTSKYKLKEAMLAGSYRRGHEKLGDIDIVCQPRSRIEDDKQISGGVVHETFGKFQVDIVIAWPKFFGAALQYLTGSAAHNIWLRTRAKEMNLKLGQNGIHNKNGKLVAGTTEKEVYAALELEVPPPSEREYPPEQGKAAWSFEGHNQRFLGITFPFCPLCHKRIKEGLRVFWHGVGDRKSIAHVICHESR